MRRDTLDPSNPEIGGLEREWVTNRVRADECADYPGAREGPPSCLSFSTTERGASTSSRT